VIRAIGGSELFTQDLEEGHLGVQIEALDVSALNTSDVIEAAVKETAAMDAAVEEAFGNAEPEPEPMPDGEPITVEKLFDMLGYTSKDKDKLQALVTYITAMGKSNKMTFEAVITRAYNNPLAFVTAFEKKLAAQAAEAGNASSENAEKPAATKENLSKSSVNNEEPTEPTNKKKMYSLGEKADIGGAALDALLKDALKMTPTEHLRVVLVEFLSRCLTSGRASDPNVSATVMITELKKDLDGLRDKFSRFLDRKNAEAKMAQEAQAGKSQEEIVPY
jgi:hypothetical protein